MNSDKKKSNMITPRMRLDDTLNHRQPDRVCVDFGAGGQTGLEAVAVTNLRKAIFGDDGYRVKIIEPYQMLGEVDEELRKALGLDVVGINTPSTMFGSPTLLLNPSNRGLPSLIVILILQHHHRWSSAGPLLTSFPR